MALCAIIPRGRRKTKGGGDGARDLASDRSNARVYRKFLLFSSYSSAASDVACTEPVH